MQLEGSGPGASGLHSGSGTREVGLVSLFFCVFHRRREKWKVVLLCPLLYVFIPFKVHLELPACFLQNVEELEGTRPLQT
jgi:hypothetical protein